MMREGTTSLTTLQIAERLETNAATVNVSAGISSEDASLFASSLTEQFADTLALSADILLNPSFPAEELNRRRDVRPRALRRSSRRAHLADH